MVLEDGARDPKEIAQPPEGRTPLQQGALNHSSSLLRVIVGSSVQVARVILEDIQVLSHLMEPSKPNITRMYSSSSNQCSTAKPHRTASLQQPLQHLAQHSSSQNLDKNHYTNQEYDSQPLQL